MPSREAGTLSSRNTLKIHVVQWRASSSGPEVWVQGLNRNA
jgi:hypothetical protein